MAHDITIPCPETGCDWYVLGRPDSGVGEKMAVLITKHMAVAHGKTWPHIGSTSDTP